MSDEADTVQVDIHTEKHVKRKVDKFKCKWRKCQTSLHNLETLLRHVMQVHKPTEVEIQEAGGFVCWWKRCPLLKPDNEGYVDATQAFETFGSWQLHIQKEHIYAVAMRYGDGPPSRPKSNYKSTQLQKQYLSNDKGQITTPDFTQLTSENIAADTLDLTQSHSGGPPNFKKKAEMEAERSYLKVHGIAKSSKRHSQEVIRAMAARKEKIGPGIDRGGCTFINEARRATFVQNPGIERVVDADY